MTTGTEYANQAYTYKDSGIPYSQLDCIAFVNKVRKDCHLNTLYNGTNTTWRNGSLSWKGTIAEAREQFGDIPNGAMLFIIIPESDPNYNPPQKYWHDGIGDVSHVGIYVQPGCMQSGGYGGRGVHYNNSLNGLHFTHVGMTADIDYGTTPAPTPGDNPLEYNDFWMSPDLNLGSYSVEASEPSAMQKQNANNIKSFFEAEGWSLQAICGMLGNMQAESTINPARIQDTNRFRLPDNGTDLSLLTNDVMKNFYKEYYGVPNRAFAIGLVQWDGYSTSNGEPQQKLVAYAIRNNYNWYDGWCQCQRIRGEWQKDSQYHFFNPVTIDGTYFTFANYVTSTESPTTLAHAWQAGYERNAGGLGYRGVNAEWWYNYFTGGDAPEPVPPEDPEQSDPDEPYDPDNPSGPDADGQDELPVWFFIGFMIPWKRRKETKRPCRKM